MWFIDLLKVVLPFVPKIIDRVRTRRQKKKWKRSEFKEPPMVHLKRMKDLD